MDELSSFGLVLMAMGLVGINAASVFLILSAFWRLLFANRLAYRESLAGYRNGYFWNRRSGMVIDQKTGLVSPSDTPVITGKKSVLGPLIGGVIIGYMLYYFELLLIPLPF